MTSDQIPSPKKARLCWKIVLTGEVGKEQWRPVEEAELYLKRRLSGSDGAKVENWIEYETHPAPAK